MLSKVQVRCSLNHCLGQLSLDRMISLELSNNRLLYNKLEMRGYKCGLKMKRKALTIKKKVVQACSVEVFSEKVVHLESKRNLLTLTPQQQLTTKNLTLEGTILDLVRDNQVNNLITSSLLLDWLLFKEVMKVLICKDKHHITTLIINSKFPSNLNRMCTVEALPD